MSLDSPQPTTNYATGDQGVTVNVNHTGGAAVVVTPSTTGTAPLDHTMATPNRNQVTSMDVEVDPNTQMPLRDIVNTVDLCNHVGTNHGSSQGHNSINSNNDRNVHGTVDNTDMRDPPTLHNIVRDGGQSVHMLQGQQQQQQPQQQQHQHQHQGQLPQQQQVQSQVHATFLHHQPPQMPPTGNHALTQTQSMSETWQPTTTAAPSSSTLLSNNDWSIPNSSGTNDFVSAAYTLRTANRIGIPANSNRVDEITNMNNMLNTFTAVLDRVKAVTTDIGDNCAICYYSRRVLVQHMLALCPLMKDRCYQCYTECGLCCPRSSIPSGHCYFCLLPRRKPNNEPYHGPNMGSRCEMWGRDRIKPLAMLYWEDNKENLVEEFGIENVGDREKAARWIVQQNAAGFLNAIILVSRLNNNIR